MTDCRYRWQTWDGPAGGPFEHECVRRRGHGGDHECDCSETYSNTEPGPGPSPRDGYVSPITGHRWPCPRFYTLAPETTRCTCRPYVVPGNPRRFHLIRHEDPSGVSGTGPVAEGVQWTDGTVTLRWYGDRPSTADWRSIEDVLAIHGHNGLTVVAWLDGDG